MPRTSGFTEFSFGFALTHSLIKAFSASLAAAPVFPSLLQEGSKGGGHDLKLPLIPIPIFIQFKIPYVLRRSSKLHPPAYALPYYRIPLRTSEPNQHQLLLDLEGSEPLVFYAMPLFHEVHELDSHFLSAAVHSHCTFVPPSKIGKLNDSPHHLSYQAGAAVYWLRSDPKPIEGHFMFEQMAQAIKLQREVVRSELHLSGRVPTPNEIDMRRRKTLDEVAGIIQKIITTEKSGTPADTELFQTLDLEEKARRIAYIAQVRLGATVALVDAADGSMQNASAPAD